MHYLGCFFCPLTNRLCKVCGWGCILFTFFQSVLWSTKKTKINTTVRLINEFESPQQSSPGTNPGPLSVSVSLSVALSVSLSLLLSHLSSFLPLHPNPSLPHFISSFIPSISPNRFSPNTTFLYLVQSSILFSKEQNFNSSHHHSSPSFSSSNPDSSSSAQATPLASIQCSLIHILSFLLTYTPNLQNSCWPGKPFNI